MILQLLFFILAPDLVGGLDEIKYGVAPRFLLGRSDEKRGQFLPFPEQFFFEKGHIVVGDALAYLVSLREHDGDRHTVLATEIKKTHVDLLGLMPDIDQDKQAGQLATLQNVMLDHLHERCPLLLAAGRISIAGKVYYIPIAVVDAEVVDKKRFAWLLRGLGKRIVGGEHIDKRGFSDIAPADESILRHIGVGALVGAGIAYLISCILDFHR